MPELELPNGYIKVLDHGYVGLTGHMGDDSSVINAARVSFDKQSKLQEDGSLEERDRKLMAYLIRNKEYSVFRQATVQFELYMPLMTARQFWKYIVGSANIEDGVCLNESSRRYLTEEPTWYIPGVTEWRGVPENKKQGSGEPIDPRIGAVATEELEELISRGEEQYNRWLSMGIAPEQARIFLPAAYSMYVRCRTTMSLAAFIHFIEERLEHKAQHEIYVYAEAMLQLVSPLFPVTFRELQIGE